LARSAEIGELRAWVLLGNAHRRGRGVPRDLARARECYARAASGHDDRFAPDGAELLRLLDNRAGPRGRAHADGWDDWYPDDVAPPKPMSYPCALSALPRKLATVPKEERRFWNHVLALTLEATRSK